MSTSSYPASSHPTPSTPAAPVPADAAIQISIIMPVHNAASYLLDALDALLGERDVSLELIAINDGSTDDTLSLLQAAARADARLVVIDQSNQGPALARNAGLQVARGEWITFVDADDWVAPGTYREWHRQACAHGVDALIGNGYRFTADPRHEPVSPLFKRQPWGDVVTGGEWIVHCTERDEWPHYVWLQFIRRAVIERHGLRFVPGLLHQDILWTLQLALVARRMAFYGRPTHAYRRNPTSIVNTPSQTTVVRRANSYIHILKTLVDTADRHGDPRLRRALLRHANVECGYFDQVLRRKLQGRQSRRDVARRFHDMKLWPALLRGATGMRQYRRLARFYLAVERYRR